MITGVGFFQLIDGVVNHKILGIHQIRYGVDLLVYDVVWIGSAILLMLIGAIVLWYTRPARTPAPATCPTHTSVTTTLGGRCSSIWPRPWSWSSP